jgi:hypothetical protein
MALIGPRFAILVWWLFDSTRWELAISNFFVAFIGWLFIPWTTMSYVLVWSSDGLRGFDWIILGLGVMFDVLSYTSGGYGRRAQYSSAS